MGKHTYFPLLAIPLAAALFLSACGTKNVKKNAGTDADMTGNTETIPALEVVDSSGTSTEGNIRGTEFQPQEGLRTINFDYDRYELSEAEQKILQANADLLKARKEWAVLVEGHCDDRGTTEYNLALGQKRAKAVRDYYVRLGVTEDSVGTISYGEEMPLCTEEAESCWQTNRRAETKVKAK